MSFARQISSRSGSFVANTRRKLLSGALPVLAGLMVLCSGISVFAPAVQAQTVVAQVAAGGYSTNVAVNTVTNTVYVTNESPFTVSVFNGATNALEATIPIPYPDSSNTQVALNVDSINNMVYVLTESYIVSVIDGATNTVVANINLGEDPLNFAMNTATDTIYIAGSNEVSVIDGATNTVVTTIPMGFVPGSMAVNPVTNMVYVGSGGRSVFGEYVSVIDGATNTLSNTITLSPTQQSDSIVAVNSVSNTVYVGTYGPTYVINGATNAVSTLATSAISANGFSINPTTNMVYETLQYATSAGGTNVEVMLVINGATNAIVATIPEPNIALVMNNVTNTLYGINAATNPSTLYTISGTTYAQQTLQIPGSTAYGSVAVNSVTNMVYTVAFASPGTLSVLDGSLTPSTVAVSCAPNSFSYGVGNDTTCTANVTGGTTPTGTITWTVNGSAWTTSTLSNGTASVTGLTSDSAGAYTVSAAYSGDTVNATSSGSTSVTIAKANPLLAASCSPNPVVAGGYYSCTAELGSGVTGSVTWPSIFGGATTPLSGGIASTPLYQATFGAGNYSGTVTYNGDSNNSVASSLVSLTASPATQTISFVTIASPITFGVSPIALSATASSGLGVIFSVISGPGSVSGNTLTLTGPGTVVVAANQPGNSNYAAAAQTTQSVTVLDQTITTLASSLNPSNSGQNVIFTALVNTGGSTPTGNVTFSNSGTSIGTGTVSTVSTTNLLPYSAGLDMLGGTASLAGVAAPDASMTAVAFDSQNRSPSLLLSGLPESTYTFSVWLEAPVGTGPYTVAINILGGTGAATNCNVTAVWSRCLVTGLTNTTSPGVQIGEGNAPLVYAWGAQFEEASTAGPYVATSGASATGAGGLATFTTSSLPVGTATITAAYSGDGANAASVSSALNQIVNNSMTPTTSVASVVLTQYHAATPVVPVTATGAVGAITYSISPSLPTGLSFSSSTGTLSGTPTVASAAATYTVATSDTNGDSANGTFSLTVNSPVSATRSVPSTTLTQGTSASFVPVTATGGTNPLTFAVSPSLPAGLAMSSNGTVSGTASVASPVATYTVTVTDLNGATATATFSLTVDTAVTAVTVVPSTILTRNLAGSAFAPVTGSGGEGTLVLTVTPALPAGLAMASNGLISGTATVPLTTSTFTVTATDLNGATATATFSLTVNGVAAKTVVASTYVTLGKAAVSFTPVIGLGGAGTLTYSLSPALPAGLSFSAATGTVSGTATVSIPATSFVVTVTDSTGATATATFTLTANGAVTATTVIPLNTLTQNVAATFTPVTATGGTAPLTFTATTTLPAGLSMAASTGAISGTPTVAVSSSTYIVTVTDANGSTATKSFNLTVDAAVSATNAVPSTTLGLNQMATPFTPVTATGGAAPLTFSVSPALPTGLSFGSRSGTITGEPTVALNATSYTVTVTDANNATATATFTLTVSATPLAATTAVPSSTLTQSHPTSSFSPVTATGGTAPLTFSVSPALPAGLSFSASGVISGTPNVTTAGRSYTVTVTDANSTTATATFNLSVVSMVSATTSVASTTLTQGHASTAFTPVLGTGGAGALAYTITPTLPSGLSLSPATGAVSGTPLTASSSTTYTVTVSDANNATATATFTLSVTGALTANVSVPSTTLTQNHAAAAFTPVTGSGGAAPLVYTVSPALPAGLSLATANGQITGTPTATSSASAYTVTVTDANNTTATATFTLAVDATLTATTAIPSTTVTENQLASVFTPVVGSGGTLPLTYAVSPAMPAGLIFSSTTGAISGTPTGVGTSSTYTVTVTDATGAKATATFNLTVNGSSLTATTIIPLTSLTSGTAAKSFTPVTTAGGVAPLKFTVSPGLPFNMSLASTTGVISGTPLATLAVTNYTITVTDATGATATATFSISVDGAVTATTVSSTNTVTENNPASFTPVAGSGGTAPLSYTVTPTLPAGLSMNAATGTVSGTPTVTISLTSYTVTVTDANGAKATKTFFLSVGSAVTATTVIPSTSLTEGVAAPSFTPVTGAGGVGTRTFSVSPALPAGLSFSSSTGAITGTPSVVSTESSFAVTVTDSNGATASASFNLTVLPPA